MSNKNMFFSLKEANDNNSNVTYESLIEQVNIESENFDNNDIEGLSIDDYVASELNYNENFTKKQLEFIADYYGISKRKKKKQDLIEEIVIFEKEPSNFDIVQGEKLCGFILKKLVMIVS